MKSIYALVVLLIAAFLAGCGGPGKASVKGKVTYGSKTVKSGEVVIFGGDGLPKTGKITRDGTYEIADVTSGDGKIVVRSPHPKEASPAGHGEKVALDPVDVKNWCNRSVGREQ
jgi:hypothetical protein